MGCGSVDDSVWLQATLPIKLGGFGLSSVSTISQSAFLASWAHSLHELPARFPDMNSTVQQIASTSQPMGLLGYTLNSILTESQTLCGISVQTKRFQHKLVTEITKATASSLLENTTSLRDEARLRSLNGKGAGAWLSAIPSSRKFALNSCEFRLVAFLRLGLPLPYSDDIHTCDCGRTITDSSGYHQITCKSGGGPVWTHNSIVSVWSDCLSELKLHHKKEPRDRYSTSDSRPDIIVFDTGAGSNVELDVALAHPWSSDIFPTSATTDGAAASRREERKKAGYDRETYPGGLSVKVTPLVLEHFGRWGKQGEEYLDQLSKRPTDDFGRPNRAEFKDNWRKRFAIQLQKCNAGVFLRKTSALSGQS